MSKKTYALVSGVVGGLGTIASAVITYINPQYAAACVAAVGIASTAIIEICALFIKESES